MTTSSSWMIMPSSTMAFLWNTLLSQSVYNTRLLPGDWLIDCPEQRRLLTRIDTLEFSKWQYKTINQFTSWYDVFDVPWTCFAWRSIATKHADFCHLSHSYRKCKNNHINGENWNISVNKYMSRDGLFNLMLDEKILKKQESFLGCTKNCTPWLHSGWT